MKLFLLTIFLIINTSLKASNQKDRSNFSSTTKAKQFFKPVPAVTRYERLQSILKHTPTNDSARHNLASCHEILKNCCAVTMAIATFAVPFTIWYYNQNIYLIKS